MKRRFGHIAGSGREPFDPNDGVTDVFQQPSRSLLSEALRKPLGITALAVMIAGIGGFAVNQFFFGMAKIDDYALVTIFASGAVLLSIVLRNGDPQPAPRSKAREAGKAPPLIAKTRKPVKAKKVAKLETKRKKQKTTRREEEEAVYETFPSSALNEPMSGFAEDTNTIPFPSQSAASDQDPFAQSGSSVEGYQKALLHYQQTGDVHGQGEVLRRLGHLAKSKGLLKEGRDFYVNARNLFREIGDNYAEAAVLLDLGQVLESLGDQDAAGAAYREANRSLLDVAMSSGDPMSGVRDQAAD